VKAEAARMLGLDANVVRKGSASCHVSPLSDAGIMSTTRTPGGGGGGGEGAPSGGFGGRWQAATTQATAARRVVARMATGYTGGGPRVAKSTLKSGPGEALLEAQLARLVHELHHCEHQSGLACCGLATVAPLRR